jgi:ketosteroid isomerase-like protein
LKRGLLLLALYGISVFGQSSPINSQSTDNRTSDDEKVTAQIRSLDQKLNDAAVSRDLAFFAKTTAPGYVGVAPNGMILDKSLIAEHYQSGSLHYEAVSDSEIDIRLHGDCAVLTAFATVKGRDGETDLSGTYRIMRVFLRRGGEWQIVAFQATPVRAAVPKS